MKIPVVSLIAFAFFTYIPVHSYADSKIMKLPLKAVRIKEADLQDLLNRRYSCRNFQDKTIKLDNLALILWASAGIKYDALAGASRVIPSAGATYPLELYLVVGPQAVEGLREGLYHYLAARHSLELVKAGDQRSQLSEVCLGQSFIARAPASLIITAYFSRTTQRYAHRGERYAYIEVGHACQNAYLAVTALGLGTVEVGAFDDDSLKQLLGLAKDCTPLSIMPVGYPAE